MSKAIYKKDNDIKAEFTITMDGSAVDPTLVPVDILLWTNRKADAYRCGWDGSAWYGGASNVGTTVKVAIDAPLMWDEGEIHGEAVLHYADAEMPDKVQDKTVKIELTVSEDDDTTVNGTITHVCYGLSAYDLAVQQGYVGTLAEWLASLQGEQGIQGEPGNIIYPSIGVDDNGELYVMMPDENDSATMCIDENGYLCQILPNLI